MNILTVQRYAHSLNLLKELQKEVCLNHFCTGKECFEIYYCSLCETIGESKVDHKDDCIMKKVEDFLNMVNKLGDK